MQAALYPRKLNSKQVAKSCFVCGTNFLLFTLEINNCLTVFCDFYKSHRTQDIETLVLQQRSSVINIVVCVGICFHAL